MNINLIRSVFFALMLCIGGVVVVPSLAAGQQAVNPWFMLFKVDYELSLEKMIQAGHYDSVSTNIFPESFPMQGRGQEQLLILELFSVDHPMSSEEVLAQLIRQGLRPATIVELLAFGAEFPDEQRVHPIIALGSIAKLGGGRQVPCLYGDRGGRHLCLYWWSEDAHVGDQFLAVRNK